MPSTIFPDWACCDLCAGIFARPPARAALSGAIRTRRVSRASAESRPGTLLVFPFENESRMANLDWLGEGLAELTVERLQDRGLSVLSRQERLALSKRWACRIPPGFRTPRW